MWTAILVEPAVAIDTATIDGSSFLLSVNAKNYRHCHNTPRRVYCHTKEPLPVRVRENEPIYDLVTPSQQAPIECHHQGYGPLRL
jgi:ribosomal protein L25 (general stress protein Ctc)